MYSLIVLWQRVSVITKAEVNISKSRGKRAMPELSRFFGIVIRMFYNDHRPRKNANLAIRGRHKEPVYCGAH
jgi:hypothetical protein